MFFRVLSYKLCREKSPISKEKFGYMVHFAMCHKNHVSMKTTREENETVQCYLIRDIFIDDQK